MCWSIVVYLHLWVKSLWACKKWVSCAPYSRMIWLGYFLKESLIFVSFGFSFLTEQIPQRLFKYTSWWNLIARILSPVRKKAVDLNIPYINSHLNALFSVWYCFFPHWCSQVYWLCFALIMEWNFSLTDEWKDLQGI